MSEQPGEWFSFDGFGGMDREVFNPGLRRKGPYTQGVYAAGTPEHRYGPYREVSELLSRELEGAEPTVLFDMQKVSYNELNDALGTHITFEDYERAIREQIEAGATTANMPSPMRVETPDRFGPEHDIPLADTLDQISGAGRYQAMQAGGRAEARTWFDNLSDKDQAAAMVEWEKSSKPHYTDPNHVFDPADDYDVRNAYTAARRAGFDTSEIPGPNEAWDPHPPWREEGLEGPPGGVARETGGKPAAPTSAVDDLPVPEEYLGDLRALHEKGTGELIIANPTVGDLVAKADELEGEFWAKIEPGLGRELGSTAEHIYADVMGGGPQSIFRQLVSQGEIHIPDVVSSKGWWSAGEAGDDLWEAYVDDFLTRYPDQDPIIFLSREVEEGVWAADRESGIQWSHLDAVGLSVREWLDGYALRKTARKVMEGGK